MQKIKKILLVDPCKLVGLIVSHMETYRERMNTRKRNTINIVQCSKEFKNNDP